MADKKVKCPQCGATVSGKFCNQCGTPVAGAKCAKCSAPLSAGSKFCHSCGTPTPSAGAGSSPQSQPVLPWALAGAALVALIITIAVTLSRSNPGPPVTATQPAAAGPTDLSQLTPRERADRLFNRVMTAAEQGDTSDASFFAPMTVQAYEMLGTLDNDALYHVGLVKSVTGDLEGVLEYADSLESNVPNHLFAAALRIRAAQLSGDSATAMAQYRTFLENYDAELAAGRREYGEHSRMLTNLQADAQVALGR